MTTVKLQRLQTIKPGHKRNASSIASSFSLLDSDVISNESDDDAYMIERLMKIKTKRGRDEFMRQQTRSKEASGQEMMRKILAKQPRLFAFKDKRRDQTRNKTVEMTFKESRNALKDGLWQRVSHEDSRSLAESGFSLPQISIH